MSKTEYEENQKNGRYTEFYKDGNKRFEGSYLKGSKHGIWKEWSESGYLVLQSHYFKDKLNGEWTTFRSNGTKLWAGNYINGLEDGLWVAWYENGQKKSEGVKKEGKFFTGLYTEWSDQGVKVLEGAYEQWGKHGIWRGYDDFGNKVFEEYYQNGDIIRSITF